MSRWLVGAAYVWPLMLAVGLWARIEDPRALTGTLVYGIASLVCHQIPVRSFHAAGVAWPVCGRCAGLYAAAPLGALIALRTGRGLAGRSAGRLIALAAAPTLATVGLEWVRPDVVGNVTRFAAALPLGWTIAAVLVDTTRSRTSMVTG